MNDLIIIIGAITLHGIVMVGGIWMFIKEVRDNNDKNSDKFHL